MKMTESGWGDGGILGDVGSVILYDTKTGKLEDEIYECLDDAIEKGNCVSITIRPILTLIKILSSNNHLSQYVR